jgi:hypothetical protein
MNAMMLLTVKTRARKSSNGRIGSGAIRSLTTKPTSRAAPRTMLVDETGRGVEIVCVHGHDESINHFSHRILPRARGLLRWRASPWSPPLPGESRVCTTRRR